MRNHSQEGKSKEKVTFWDQLYSLPGVGIQVAKRKGYKQLHGL